jgi:hypothetical protein
MSELNWKALEDATKEKAWPDHTYDSMRDNFADDNGAWNSLSFNDRESFQQFADEMGQKDLSKKFALIDLYSKKFGRIGNEVSDNFEVFSETFWGRKLTVDEQFKNVQSIYNDNPELDTANNPYQFAGMGQLGKGLTVAGRVPADKMDEKLTQIFDTAQGQELMRYHETGSVIKEMGKAWGRGSVNIASASSGLYRFMGWHEWADEVDAYIDYGMEYYKADEKMQAKWNAAKGGGLFDINWWLVNSVEMMPFIAVASIAGGGTGAAVAKGLIRAGAKSTAVAMGARTTASLTMSAGEALSEAGSSMKEIIAAGGSKEDAVIAGYSHFKKNMGMLMFSNTLQLVFGAGAVGLQSKILKALCIGIGMSIEGAEELIQDRFQREAMVAGLPHLAEKINPDKSWGDTFNIFNDQEKMKVFALATLLGFSEPLTGMYIKAKQQITEGKASPFKEFYFKRRMGKFFNDKYSKLSKIPTSVLKPHEKQQLEVIEKHQSKEGIIQNYDQLSEEYQDLKTKQNTETAQQILNDDLELSEMSKIDLQELTGVKNDIYNKSELLNHAKKQAVDTALKEDIKGNSDIALDKFIDFYAAKHPDIVNIQKMTKESVQDMIESGKINSVQAQKLAEQHGEKNTDFSKLYKFGENLVVSRNDVTKMMIKVAEKSANPTSVVEEFVESRAKAMYGWDGESFTDPAFIADLKENRDRLEAKGYITSQNEIEWYAGVIVKFAFAENPDTVFGKNTFTESFKQFLEGIKEFIASLLQGADIITKAVQNGELTESFISDITAAAKGEINNDKLSENIKAEPEVKQADKILEESERAVNETFEKETRQKINTEKYKLDTNKEIDVQIKKGWTVEFKENERQKKPYRVKVKDILPNGRIEITIPKNTKRNQSTAQTKIVDPTKINIPAATFAKKINQGDLAQFNKETQKKIKAEAKEFDSLIKKHDAFADIFYHNQPLTGSAKAASITDNIALKQSRERVAKYLGINEDVHSPVTRANYIELFKNWLKTEGDIIGQSNINDLQKTFTYQLSKEDQKLFPLPEAPAIPSKGQFAAVRTDDGTVYIDKNWEGNTHVNFILDFKIPPERVISGGWVKDDVYDGSWRSDAGDYGDRARAKFRVNKRLKNDKFQLSENSQIYTPKFKAWFKDSKVVDKNGKPLVVYHGTNKDFNIFDKKMRGSNRDSGIFGKGFYYSSNKKSANSYGKNIKELYLSILNPFYINDFQTKQELADYLDIDESIISKGGCCFIVQAPFSGIFSEGIKEKGHDGVITKDGEYVVFEPTQIKSATGNNGQFEPNNPDITYQFAGTNAETADKTALQEAVSFQILNLDRKPSKKLIPQKDGKIEDSNVPASNKVFELLVIPKRKIYANYTYIYERHKQHFNNAIEAQIAVEYVLEAPEFITKEQSEKNRGIVRYGNIFKKDKKSEHYRHPKVEIRIIERAGRYEIRSAFLISETQYERGRSIENNEYSLNQSGNSLTGVATASENNNNPDLEKNKSDTTFQLISADKLAQNYINAYEKLAPAEEVYKKFKHSDKLDELRSLRFEIVDALETLTGEKFDRAKITSEFASGKAATTVIHNPDYNNKMKSAESQYIRNLKQHLKTNKLDEKRTFQRLEQQNITLDDIKDVLNVIKKQSSRISNKKKQNKKPAKAHEKTSIKNKKTNKQKTSPQNIISKVDKPISENIMVNLQKAFDAALIVAEKLDPEIRYRAVTELRKLVNYQNSKDLDNYIDRFIKTINKI